MSDIKKVSFSNLESLYNSRIKPIAKTLPEISHVADKIIWQAYPPEGHGDAQGALAYVTTADDNGNGQIDSLRFNVNNIMQDLRGKNIDINNLSDSDLRYLVETITHTIGHEEGHRRGYNPEENTMPGEDEADRYADQVVKTLENQKLDITASKTISLQKEFIKLANSYDQGNKNKEADALDEAVKYLNNNNSTKDLVRLANNLDRLNLTKEADLIDRILKEAQDFHYSKEEIGKLFEDERDFESLMSEIKKNSNKIIESHKHSSFKSVGLPIFIFQKLSKFFTEETAENMDKIRKEIFPIFSDLFKAVNEKEEKEDRNKIDFVKEFTKKSDEFKEHISSSKDNIKVYGELLESFKKYLEEAI